MRDQKHFYFILKPTVLMLVFLMVAAPLAGVLAEEISGGTGISQTLDQSSAVARLCRNQNLIFNTLIVLAIKKSNINSKMQRLILTLQEQRFAIL